MKTSWMSYYWDTTPIQRRIELLTKYYSTPESVKKHLNKTWLKLPQRFKKHLAEQPKYNATF